MKGFVHSFESFGTKDGPGIRFAIFMQGCPLRCLYCHNPDTWKMNNAKYKLTPQEAFEEIQKVKAFVRGGVTISGGEPLLQPQFILELFKLCKEEDIHTAIDTSGFLLNYDIQEALYYTDLVLLDIKHINPQKYFQLTGKSLQPTLHFMEHLREIDKPVWLRYVLVPGYSDDEQDLKDWADYISKFDNVERVDILPFHQMGTHKWEQLNEDYRLKGIDPPTAEQIEKAEQIFRAYDLPVF